MAYAETFDDFLSTDFVSDSENPTPFQFREDKSEGGTLEWLNNNLDTKLRKAESRLRKYRQYWAYYKGIHWQMAPTRYNDDQSSDGGEKKPKMKVNFIWEMVEGRISQLTENKIAIVCMPQNGQDLNDLNNARSCKTLLDAWADKYDMDDVQEEAERIKAVTGTVFQYGYYDFEKGPLHPAMNQIMGVDGVKTTPEFPILDEKGKKTKQTHKGEIHVGEACLKNYGPDQVFLELEREDFKECNELDIVEYIHKEELAAKYPNKADIIRESSCDDWRWDIDTMEIYKSSNMLRVTTFWHKKTKFNPKGEKLVYIEGAILEGFNKGNPLKQGQLPVEVDYDIKVAREPYGRSFISNIEQLQDLYNTIRSGIGRDVKVGSMPKWAVPKGAVKISSLNNEFTIMEYSGPKAPEIVHNPPISDKLLGLEDKLEKQIAQFSQLFDISRGQVPTGVTANSALRFLDEQEDRRIAPLKKKRRKRIVKAFRLLATIMGEYYSEGDGRTAHLLGKGNEFLIKSIKKADFSQLYDIKIQQSSALPDSKTGKISMIVDINTSTQTDPIFTREQVIDMLDLGNEEAYIDGATVAVRAANEILNMMYEGQEVPEPQPYDNNFVHWNTFNKAIQSLTFKRVLTPDIRKQIIKRLETIEGLMFQQAKKNGKYLTALMSIPEYPIFYTPEVPLHDLAMMMAGGQQGFMQSQGQGGQMNTGAIKNIPNQQGELNATRAE